MRNTCLLCDRELTIDPNHSTYQLHPDAEDCLVRVTDLWGVATDAPNEVMPLDVEPDDDGIDMGSYPHVDEVLVEIFDSYGLPRLGGQSSGRGWSSFSLFQKCPYAWKRRYVDKVRPLLFFESEGLAIGTIVHVYLALYYAAMMPDSPYKHITPEAVHHRLMQRANPKFVNEGMRLYTAYRLFYQDENIQSLAIEHDLKDPRTGESCRYDLIAFYPEPVGHRPAGTYILEHKCLVANTQVFDPVEARLVSIADRSSGNVLAFTDERRLKPAFGAETQRNGVQEVFRLTTDHGRVLEGNAKHPVMTLDGWRSIGALTINDWVAVPRRLIASTSLPGLYADEAIALLGYLLGDGSLGQVIRFSKGHNAVLARVQQLAQRLGWPTVLRPSKDRVPYIEFLGSRHEGAYEFINSLGLRMCTAAEKVLPSITLPDHQVRMLLGGLWDTDGSIDVHYENDFAKPRIAYVTRSRELAFGVLYLLDRLGIEGSCRASSVAYKGERREVWTVKVIGRASKARFISLVVDGWLGCVRVNDAARVAHAALIDIDDEPVPCAWIRSVVSLADLDAHLRLRVRSYQTIGLGYLEQFVPELAMKYRMQDVRWERVETLLAIGRQEVFNLEVDEHHTFVANGIVTHNTAGRFDRATLEGWPNDGEVIGEVALWKKLGLDHRFGELKGVIVNIIGKQKEPQMHRTIVAPSSWLVDQHLKDLRRWEGLLNLAKQYDEFPRARQSCVGRYGMCEWFDHCASGE